MYKCVSVIRLGKLPVQVLLLFIDADVSRTVIHHLLDLYDFQRGFCTFYSCKLLPAPAALLRVRLLVYYYRQRDV